jgi:DNA-binding SARP family transcriptional activator
VYEQGLAHDPLAEPMFCGLLRCHIASGATAQALIVYRRLRDVLARVLQVAPSAEAEALHGQIRGV